MKQSSAILIEGHKKQAADGPTSTIISRREKITQFRLMAPVNQLRINVGSDFLRTVHGTLYRGGRVRHGCTFPNMLYTLYICGREAGTCSIKPSQILTLRIQYNIIAYAIKNAPIE